MALRNQRLCPCCGCWTQSKTLCVQCLHAGCDKKKKGERCYVSLGSATPKSHSMTVEEAIAKGIGVPKELSL